MADVSQDKTRDRRLNSWKEIAGYFGKDERTVKRWEVARGMPVRRVPGGSRTTVFAYVSELEGWLRSPRPDEAETESPAVVEAVTGARAHGTGPRRPGALLIAAAALAAVVFVAGAGAGMLLLNGQFGKVAPTTQHVPSEAAQQAYLSGRFEASQRTMAGFQRAVDYFDEAIRLDARFASAHAGLASAYNLISQYATTPNAAIYDKARSAAERAVAIDPSSAEGHSALGLALFFGEHDFAGSEEHFRRALMLDPDAAQTHLWYGLTTLFLGKFEMALAYFRRAQALDPDSRTIRANLAIALYHSGRREEALDILIAMTQERPDFLVTPTFLALIYLVERRFPEFLRQFEAAAQVANTPARLAIAAAARAGFASGGEAGLLQAMFDEQSRQVAAGNETTFSLAETAAAMGRTDEALGLLEAAAALGEPQVLAMGITPTLRGLHEETRFLALLKTLGLPMRPNRS